MIKEISLDDLERMRVGIDNHFSQLFIHDQLVCGEPTEENHRLMNLYGKLLAHYNDQDLTISEIDKEIQLRSDLEFSSSCF